MHLDLYGGQYGIFNKTEAAQYLRPLLTNRDQNFTKSTLFGHTFQEFDNGGHLTSMEANPLNRHFFAKLSSNSDRPV